MLLNTQENDLSSVGELHLSDTMIPSQDYLPELFNCTWLCAASPLWKRLCMDLSKLEPLPNLTSKTLLSCRVFCFIPHGIRQRKIRSSQGQKINQTQILHAVWHHQTILYVQLKGAFIHKVCITHGIRWTPGAQVLFPGSLIKLRCLFWFNPLKNFSVQSQGFRMLTFSHLLCQPFGLLQCGANVFDSRFEMMTHTHPFNCFLHGYLPLLHQNHQFDSVFVWHRDFTRVQITWKKTGRMRCRCFATICLPVVHNQQNLKHSRKQAKLSAPLLNWGKTCNKMSHSGPWVGCTNWLAKKDFCCFRQSPGWKAFNNWSFLVDDYDLWSLSGCDLCNQYRLWCTLCSRLSGNRVLCHWDNWFFSGAEP